MTGAEKIVHSIMDEAEQEAEKIMKDAREKEKTILEQADREAEAKKNQIIEKAKRKAVERRKRMLSVAELDMKKDRLAVKQFMIDKAYEKVLEELKQMDRKQYLDIIHAMFLKAVEKGDEEVIISSADSGRITEEFIDRVNKSLIESGKKGELKISEATGDIKGGFILKSGSIQINNSFESLVRMERDLIEPEVAAILFNGE